MNARQLMQRALACAMVAMACAGCTGVSPYRQKIVEDRPDQHFYAVEPCGIVDGKPIRMRDQPRAERLECFSHAVERTPEYTLFFVEFDEQGRLYHRAQLDALLAYLRRLETRSRPDGSPPRCASHNDGVSLVTFVHGWRHNARYDDDNVNLAREVLRTTHKGETAGAHYNPASCAREVVGVYVGWRGASTSVSDVPSGFLRAALGFVWEVPSVWDRKNTAQNVAVGSVRELFSLLKVYQDRRNEKARLACTWPVAPPGIAPALMAEVYQCMPVRHLIVGHSYGALIVHNAIAQHLLENVARGTLDESTDCEPGRGGREDGRALVRAYADLIVLLNPAVEGARYEPLHEAMSARAATFCPGQKPVMLVLTSHGDEATRLLFRGVRFVNTLLESNTPFDANRTPAQRAYMASEEGRSSIRTLGHNERYHTHELVSWERYVALHAEAADPPEADDWLWPQEREAVQMRRTYAHQLRALCASLPPGQRESMCPDAAQRMKKAFDQDVDNSALLAPQREAAAFAQAVAQGEAPLTDCQKAALADLHLSRTLRGRSPQGTSLPSGWSASFLGGTAITHLPGYRPDPGDFPGIAPEQVREIFEPHSPATPVWNVYIRDDTVMDDHGNINGHALVDLIKQVYRSVVIRSFDPGVLEKLEQIAGAELAQCSRALAAR